MHSLTVFRICNSSGNKVTDVICIPYAASCGCILIVNVAFPACTRTAPLSKVCVFIEYVHFCACLCSLFGYNGFTFLFFSFFLYCISFCNHSCMGHESGSSGYKKDEYLNKIFLRMRYSMNSYR